MYKCLGVGQEGLPGRAVVVGFPSQSRSLGNPGTVGTACRHIGCRFRQPSSPVGTPRSSIRLEAEDIVRLVGRGSRKVTETNTFPLVRPSSSASFVCSVYSWTFGQLLHRHFLINSRKQMHMTSAKINTLKLFFLDKSSFCFSQHILLYRRPVSFLQSLPAIPHSTLASIRYLSWIFR